MSSSLHSRVCVSLRSLLSLSDSHYEQRLPALVAFVSAHTLVINAQTSQPAEVAQYRSLLSAFLDRLFSFLSSSSSSLELAGLRLLATVASGLAHQDIKDIGNNKINTIIKYARTKSDSPVSASNSLLFLHSLLLFSTLAVRSCVFSDCKRVWAMDAAGKVVALYQQYISMYSSRYPSHMARCVSSLTSFVFSYRGALRPHFPAIEAAAMAIIKQTKHTYKVHQQAAELLALLVQSSASGPSHSQQKRQAQQAQAALEAQEDAAKAASAHQGTAALENEPYVMYFQKCVNSLESLCLNLGLLKSSSRSSLLASVKPLAFDALPTGAGDSEFACAHTIMVRLSCIAAIIKQLLCPSSTRLQCSTLPVTLCNANIHSAIGLIMAVLKFELTTQEYSHFTHNAVHNSMLLLLLPHVKAVMLDLLRTLVTSLRGALLPYVDTIMSNLMDQFKKLNQTEAAAAGVPLLMPLLIALYTCYGECVRVFHYSMLSSIEAVLPYCLLQDTCRPIMARQAHIAGLQGGGGNLHQLLYNLKAKEAAASKRPGDDAAPAYIVDVYSAAGMDVNNSLSVACSVAAIRVLTGVLSYCGPYLSSGSRALCDRALLNIGLSTVHLNNTRGGDAPSLVTGGQLLLELPAAYRLAYYECLYAAALAPAPAVAAAPGQFIASRLAAQSIPPIFPYALSIFQAGRADHHEATRQFLHVSLTGLHRLIRGKESFNIARDLTSFMDQHAHDKRANTVAVQKTESMFTQFMESGQRAAESAQAAQSAQSHAKVEAAPASSILASLPQPSPSPAPSAPFVPSSSSSDCEPDLPFAPPRIERHQTTFSMTVEADQEMEREDSNNNKRTREEDNVDSSASASPTVSAFAVSSLPAPKLARLSSLDSLQVSSASVAEASKMSVNEEADEDIPEFDADAGPDEEDQ